MTSLYAQSIPVTIKYLGNFAAILEKGRQFADEKGIEHEKMIQYRLIADMRGLDFQVHCCCNTAKFLASRLGGGADVFFADDEKTFDELLGRITKTIELLKNVAPDSFDGKEEAPIVIETKAGNFKFTGQRYGVPLGAFDYMKDVFEKA